jgi:hypothetical protein
MLDGLLGTRLVFWLGSQAPLPAPVEVLNALTRVEITNDAGKGDGFQLGFTAVRTGVTGFGLIESGVLAPMTRVILGLVMGATPEALIDGVITHVQTSPGSGPGQATVTVTGRDLTVLMDLEERNAEYPNRPDFAIVAEVLGRYARYGVVPAPTATSDFPIMTERVPRQQETDLRFLQRLAERNGFVFYLEPVTFGVTKAFFGPPSRAGVPQPALSVDLGAATNVKSLAFAGDSLAAVGTSGVFVEPFSKSMIPIPALPLRTTLQRETGNQSAGTAATRALAATMNAPDPYTADGELDGVRYGRVLRARGLVGVRGAGLTHDGFWYVQRVTHVLTRGDYSQRFALSREGTGALTPLVRP